MEKFNKEYLENLGIYELRALARDVGVKSPTTKKQKELVESILKIQNGEVKAITTNKGRPPKKISFSAINIDYEQIDGKTPIFEHSNDREDDYVLCNDGEVESLSKNYIPCSGIFREIEGRKFIYNHMEAVKYVNVSQSIVEKYNLKVNDYVVGTAVETGFRFGYLDSIEDVNFSKVKEMGCSGIPKVAIKEIKNLDTMRTEILSQQTKQIKIILELEVNDYYVVNLRNDCIYFYSGELDSVKKSYNALLDALRLVQNLAKSNKPFTLYMLDVDYIFNVLNVYLRSLNTNNPSEFLDAGQFLKTLLVSVKNSASGNIVIYESKKYKRNEYLDAILNKYL